MKLKNREPKWTGLTKFESMWIIFWVGAIFGATVCLIIVSLNGV